MKEKFPVPEIAEENPKFNINEALNNREFLDFLSSYPDAETLDASESNAEEIERRFKTFEDKNYVQEKLKDFYEEEIFSKANIELAPNKKELRSVDAFAKKTAIESPEILEIIGNALRQKERIDEETKKLELDVNDLLILAAGSKPEYLDVSNISLETALEKTIEETEKIKERKEALGKGMGFFKTSMLIGWLFRSKEDKLAMEKNFEELNNNLEVLKTTLENKKMLESVKNILIETLPVSKKVKKKAQKIVRDSFMEFLDPQKEFSHSLKKLTAAKKYLQSLSLKKEHDYLEKTEVSKIAGNLERLITNKITKELLEAVYTIKLKSRPLKQMGEEIKLYLEKETRPAATKAVETLLKNPRIPSVKKILLRRLFMERLF